MRISISYLSIREARSWADECPIEIVRPVAKPHRVHHDGKAIGEDHRRAVAERGLAVFVDPQSRHARGQALWIADGAARVRTEYRAWALLPNRIAWIPPNTPHQIALADVRVGWSLLLARPACLALPRQPSVLALSPVVAALTQEASSWCNPFVRSPAQARLARVLVDELARAAQDPLSIPLPSDRRALRIATAIVAAPGDARTELQWARDVALSPRALRRLFAAQTGMTFSRWRAHVRVAHALELLRAGASVGEAADALGYASPSAFIAMFRRAMGESPTRFIEHSSSRGLSLSDRDCC